jgi:S1-C subfamily serine protease
VRLAPAFAHSGTVERGAGEQKHHDLETHGQRVRLYDGESIAGRSGNPGRKENLTPGAGEDLRRAPRSVRREFFRLFFRRQTPQEDSPPREYIRRAQGSGFIISEEGYILTNNHVVENADKITVELVDGRTLDAEIVGTDPESDVAVVRIRTDKLTPVALDKRSGTEELRGRKREPMRRPPGKLSRPLGLTVRDLMPEQAQRAGLKDQTGVAILKVSPGAEYVDREVVMDGNLITSRWPPDLPAFCRQIFAAIRQAV